MAIRWTPTKRALVLPERGGPPGKRSFDDDGGLKRLEREMARSRTEHAWIERGLARSSAQARAPLRKLMRERKFPPAGALDVDTEVMRRQLEGKPVVDWWIQREGPVFALEAACAALPWWEDTDYVEKRKVLTLRRGYLAELGGLSSETIGLADLRATFAALAEADYAAAAREAKRMFARASAGAKIAIAFALPDVEGFGDDAARAALSARKRIKRDVEYPVDVRLLLASVRSPQLAQQLGALGSTHLFSEETVLTLLHRLGDAAAPATAACVDSLVKRGYRDWTTIKMLARAHFMIDTDEARRLGARWRSVKQLAPLVSKALAA